MRVWLRRICIGVAAFAVIILLLPPLLYIHPVAGWAGRVALGYAGRNLGVGVSVGDISLAFPLRLSVDSLAVTAAGGDTLMRAGSLRVNVAPAQLLRQTVLVDTLVLSGLSVASTGGFLEGMDIWGRLDGLSGRASVGLASGRAVIYSLSLSGGDIGVRVDTPSPDSVTSPTPWRVDAHRVSVSDVSFSMFMPSDTLSLSAGIGRGEVVGASADLEVSRYSVERIALEEGFVTYDAGVRARNDGLDPMHLALGGIRLSVDSVVFHEREVRLLIRAFSAGERSGLVVSSLLGSLYGDSAGIRIPLLEARTPSSSAEVRASVPYSAVSAHPSGSMRLSLNTSIGKRDVFILAGGLPADFRDAYPGEPAVLAVTVDGNLSSLNLRRFEAVLPGALRIAATGHAGNITDSIRRSFKADLEVTLEQSGLPLTLMAPSDRGRFALPGVVLKGEASLEGGMYRAGLRLTEGEGKVELAARYHTGDESYGVRLYVDSLEPLHFLPGDSLIWLSASLRGAGRGLDPFADSTRAAWEGRVRRVQYGSASLEDAVIRGTLNDHRLRLGLKSLSPYASADIAFDGTLYKGKLEGAVTGDVDSLDLRQLGVMEEAFATSFQLFAEMESDLDSDHRADLTLGNWELSMGERSIKPKTLTMHARSARDTTGLSFHVGDFAVLMSAGEAAPSVAERLSSLAESVAKEVSGDSSVSLSRLTPLLPGISLDVHLGKDNPVYNILKQNDIDFNDFDLKATLSPGDGLRLDASLYALNLDTFRVDTVRISVRPDTMGLRYLAEVTKKAYRRQQPFNGVLRGTAGDRHADAEILYTNSRNETGLHLGVRATHKDGSVYARFFPGDPVIAFNTFSLNPNNYIRFKSVKDIEADVKFTGQGNSSLWLRSVGGNGEGYPELHAELNSIDMGAVSSGLAPMAPMEGMMSADLRYAPSEESFMVVGDVHIDSLRYDGGDVGELMLSAVYLPLDESTHQIDAHFYHDRAEAASASAVYEVGKERLTGSLSVDSLRLAMLTPFIPGHMASFDGRMSGRLDISGRPSSPVVDGYVRLDSGSVYTPLMASRFRTDDRKVEIKASRAVFDGYRLYAAGKNPLELSGEIAFDDLDRVRADLRVKGDNLQVLDVGRNAESIVYGRLLAGIDATLRGPLDAISFTGDVKLLGGTNVTYVMKESPLTVQDRLKDLVTFTSFADTTVRRRRDRGAGQMPAGGMDMLLSIHIDPVVRMRADLTPDRSSFVSLEGGGDLSFRYTREGEMRLNGRYTLTGGNLKYALPVIPLKEFVIKDESYIQWDGDLLNPLLGITATQRMRTSVSLTGESPRMVNFDVGVDVKQRLDNMSLIFTIASPEDASVQTELDKLGIEGRSTQAVAMMATGMFLAGNTGKVNLNMGNALTSFLQNEISSIAGDALKTMDFSFGVDTYDQDAAMGGGQRTDYSFRFARRFYNDRLRVVVGGKVSTGDVQQNESFIDNASLEWRLNKAGTGYLKMFHDKNYKSVLDGEVTETGLGVVLRKRMLHFYELFR
jgi:hypothetical protein